MKLHPNKVAELVGPILYLNIRSHEYEWLHTPQYLLYIYIVYYMGYKLKIKE